MENQNEEKKSCCETKKCCGCKVLAAIVLLGIGGGVGFFAGKKCGMMCTTDRMHETSAPVTPAPAETPKKK